MRPTIVFRAPMRARTLDVPAGAGAAQALARDVVGIGDPLPARPSELDAAVAATREVHGAKAARLLEAFAAAPDGAFVWTRDERGDHHLGRLDGPWRYDASAGARRTGVVHVRPARWLDRPLGPDEVPPGVAAAFARGGRNFQRIRDEEAARDTTAIWQRSAPRGQS